MYSITSNTIVKNGMPFIGKVLRQVAPFMEFMVVTISEKSTDGTLEEVRKFQALYPKKVIVNFENVASPGQLTKIRNDQLQLTNSEWILFLDDDDYWPADGLEHCLNHLNRNDEILAYSVSPYQLVDFESYDDSWRGKSFSKFLRREGLRYIRPWPRDLPADKNNQPLYWKSHPQVRQLPYKFYHLSNLKGHSFRDEAWAAKFKGKVGEIKKLKNRLML